MSIDRKQAEEEFRAEAQRRGPPTQAEHGSKHGANGAWIKDDYDEKQRAHVLEVESEGPGKGLIQTDLVPDLGGDADAGNIEDDADVLGGMIDTNKPRRNR